MDYASIEESLLRGLFVVHQAFLPRGFLGAIEDKPYKFDVAKAKELLAKAGLPDGFNVTMDVRNTFAEQRHRPGDPGQLGQGGDRGRDDPG